IFDTVKIQTTAAAEDTITVDAIPLEFARALASSTRAEWTPAGIYGVYLLFVRVVERAGLQACWYEFDPSAVAPRVIGAAFGPTEVVVLMQSDAHLRTLGCNILAIPQITFPQQLRD